MGDQEHVIHLFKLLQLQMAPCSGKPYPLLFVPHKAEGHTHLLKYIMYLLKEAMLQVWLEKFFRPKALPYLTSLCHTPSKPPESVL